MSPLERQMAALYREYRFSIKKEDRLKGAWSLEQYEQKYRSALAAATDIIFTPYSAEAQD